MGTTPSNSEQKDTTLLCPIHNLPIDGICGDKNCLISGFICLKCNPEACTVTKQHELISIDEFYSRFFSKSSGTYDFKKLAEVMDNYRNIERDALQNRIDTFNTYATGLIDSKLSQFDKLIQMKLKTLNNNINDKLSKLQKDYLEAESRIDLSSFEIPENFTLEETKKFFEKNSKSVRDMENMINLVKKYSDNEKLIMNQRDMETIIYSKNLTDSNSKEILEDKLNSIIETVKEGLNELCKQLIQEKENSVIFFNGVKKFTSNPCDLKYKQDITDKCQKSYTIDSVFSCYTLHDGGCFVAWANSTHVIEIFDLKSNSVFKQLTGHTQHVYIVRHFFNRKTSTDYLLSTSYERNVKVWSLKDYTCLVTIPQCHTGYYLYSSLILFDDSLSLSYIVTSAPNELTKVWDITTGKHIKDIASASDYTYFINTWYDIKNNNIYIVNANSSDVKIYDFKTGKLFKQFKAENNTWHMSAFVHEIKEVPHLIESDGNGYLRIWNITTGLIWKTIQATGCNIRGLCLWNDQYVIAASSDKSFKVFDIIAGNIAATISGHDNVLCTVDKIVHSTYGECLFTAAIDGKIKLWTGGLNLTGTIKK